MFSAYISRLFVLCVCLVKFICRHAQKRSAGFSSSAEGPALFAGWLQCQRRPDMFFVPLGARIHQPFEKGRGCRKELTASPGLLKAV
ncbi:hypothetical protein L211DRAFT_459127 [Terfezia boudieri ATCC MYA-4762]|uniref:Secreted protein n=1 Tax=Terfezia boudieri ATCC MYA-4762 TaxID=1051890 RepID=A0A3N4LSU4_9PEZI|nr:hypothetical protein L211DRAFT_459127 [Terfezia boudieri ATCC MYA-4762]